MDKPVIATSSSNKKRKRKTKNSVPTSSTSTNGHGGSGSSSTPKGPTGQNNPESHGNTIAPVEGAVNPLSHPPSTIEQFAVAGLSIDAPVPSSIYPGFPHKPIPKPRPPRSQQVDRRLDHVAERRARAAEPKKEENAHCFQAEVADAAATTDDEDESGDENKNGDKVASREARRAAYEKRFGPVLGIIRRSLREGEIARAQKAFALFLRSEFNGRAVDLRYAESWKLGLEILQAQGEVAERERWERWERRRTGINQEEEDEKDDGVDEEDEDKEEGVDEEDEEEAKYIFAKRRVADFLKNGRTWYSVLITRYPWYPSNQNLVSNVSSLVFYPTMFRFVLDCVWNNHALELKRLERLRGHRAVVADEGADKEDRDDDSMSTDQCSQSQITDYHKSPSHYDEEMVQHASSMNRTKNNKPRGLIDRPADHIRKMTWRALRDIEREIDNLPTLPYQKDYTLLSLRATIALQVADLSICCLYPQRQEDNELEGLISRISLTHELKSSSSSRRHGLAAPLAGSEKEREEVEKSKSYRLKKLAEVLDIFTKLKQIRKQPLDEDDEKVMEEVKKELHEVHKSVSAATPRVASHDDIHMASENGEDDDEGLNGMSISAAPSQMGIDDDIPMASDNSEEGDDEGLNSHNGKQEKEEMNKRLKKKTKEKRKEMRMAEKLDEKDEKDERDEKVMEEVKKELHETSKNGEEGDNEGLYSLNEKQKEENKRRKAKKKEKRKEMRTAKKA